MPKRLREPNGVDVELVEVWEDLAHEHEDVRLKAALKLLTKHIPNSEHDTLVTILRRLFRGICSGRKAARLGFSIALTETLTYIKTNSSSISTSEIIDILDQLTVPEANTSGQDERDHYLGRLFGCESIVKSELLFTATELQQWQRLLDVICGIAAKKPWLRQECGWIFFSCVGGSLKKAKLADFALQILEKLSQHKLVRTPEGLAIWLEARRAFPAIKLPKNIWKHDDPLATKEAPTLAKVLKDAKFSSQDDGESEVQGSATWSNQLHFVWDVVLSELLRKDDSAKRVSFQEFWRVSVDDGLFTSNNSTERKHWGFSVLQKALTIKSPVVISACFSRNVVNCLMQSLKGNNRYLQRSAKKSLLAIQSRAESQKDDIPLIVAALMVASDMTDFDNFTKTKTFELLFKACGADQVDAIAITLSKFIGEPDTNDASEAAIRRKNIINVQLQLFSTIVTKSFAETQPEFVAPLQQILNGWILNVSRSATVLALPLSKVTSAFILERCSLAFEQALKLGSNGRFLVLKSINRLEQKASLDLHFPDAEPRILDTIAYGWERLNTIQQQIYGSGHVLPSERKVATLYTPALEGVALLYGLTLFQIYQDDTDAISVLGDLLDFEEHHDSKSKRSSQSNADGLLEIILSFASRPSKFLRRVTLDIFAAFTSQLTPQALQSLIDILETNEGRSGQSELFQVDGADDADDTSGKDSDVDVEMMDSDVEVISAKESASDSDDSESDDSEASSSDDESDASSSKSGSVNGDVDDNMDELMKLETSLAAALGTRKVTEADLDANDASSDSDADMTDSEMMALDEKLADVFRARQASSNQKGQQKAAKGNIVNFKNRVLDMVDIYFKTEVYQKSNDSNPNSLRFILPLLNLARMTKTKQLGDRSLELIKTLCTKCKGLQNVPSLVVPKPVVIKKESKQKKKSKSNKSRRESSEDTSDEEKDPDTPSEATTAWALDVMTDIHDEAGAANTSNAHKAACSQASLLLVKVLLKAGSGVETIVGVYAATRVRMLIDPKFQVQERLFTEWGIWCGTVAGRLEENTAGAA